MDPTDRFVDLVGHPGAPLEELALLIAAHARPGLDVGAQRSRLDDLAAGVDEPSVASLCHHLFVVEGLAGNHDDYYDPRNSYLDQVLDRRLGIPITLGVILIEVGRRVGIELRGVSMPGHFLVRGDLAGGPVLLIDPFDGGRLLDLADCESRIRKLLGPGVSIDESFVAPVGPAAIIDRMLANLEAIADERGDRPMAEWVVRLRAAMPGAPTALLRRRAASLAASYRFGEAADLLERLASADAGDRRGPLLATARRLRARLN